MPLAKKIKAQVKRTIEKTTVGKRYVVKKILKEVVDDFLLSAEKVASAAGDVVMQERLLADHMRTHPEKARQMETAIDRILDTLQIPEAQREQIKCDMLYQFFAYGFTPDEYASYEFFDKTPDERRNYVSDRESVRFAYCVNDLTDIHVFWDKMDTYDRFKPYFRREAIAVSKESDYDRFCAFVAVHPIFVRKNVNEACGRSVCLVDAGNLDPRELFCSMIASGKTILEERIIQHPSMAQINTSSVNTVRCFTMRQDGQVMVPWCNCRIGQSGAFVDNAGAGGIMVGVDHETGIMDTDGFDELGRRYETHPDSGIRFKGFAIPEWEAMLSICKEMAESMPGMGWIGWDMAYSDKGWVVVEGNSLSEVIMPQSCFKTGIRVQMKEYLKHMKKHYSGFDF